jgi:hypothetical protein
MYLALARKLRFLPQETLAKLHGNPSFNTVRDDISLQLYREIAGLTPFFFSLLFLSRIQR